jgi:hypothetical protein
MTRAILVVLDSVGIGAADDAAAFGDAGADTLGHIADACAAGAADRPGLRAGPLRLPNLDRLGLGRAAALSRGTPLPGLDATAPEGWWGYGVEVSKGKDTPSGHWEIAGVPVPFAWGYFPDTVPTFPPALTDALVREAACPASSATSTPRAPRFIERTRRGACPHRQADLLHLGRLGVPDRGARGGISASSGSMKSARSPVGWSTRSPSAGSSPGPSSERTPPISAAPPTAATTPSRRRSRRSSTGR